MESDQEAMKFTGPGMALSESEIKTRLNDSINKYGKELTGLGIWAAVSKQNSKVVGWFMLKITNKNFPEIGFMIPRNLWGRGIATEVRSALLKYGFEKEKVDGVVSVVDPKNLASIKVLEKIGMKYKKDIIVYNARLKTRNSLKYYEI
jgi:RimJ/RimL family protein N-acetyltransferase